MLIDITAKLSESDRSVTVSYDFGEDLDAAVELFGGDAVHKGFIAQSVVAAQSVIRNGLKAENTDKEIQTKMNSWKPGTRKPAMTKAQKVQREFQDMDSGAKAALLKQLQESMGKK
jgi:hypothetical protein